MLIVILVGIVYALWFDSIPASVIVAGLILYRAQRPSQFRQRVRNAWYARQVAQVGEPE
jgi:hypothetical protein